MNRVSLSFTLAIAIVIIAFAACGSKSPPVSLDGVWVGSHAMFPAIFRVKGDSVGMTLDGTFWRTHIQRTEEQGHATIALDSPAVSYTFTFVNADSAVVAISPSIKIPVAR
jgi:hypothetical protein